MLPKSGLACLFLLTCLSSVTPATAQGATVNGDVKISGIETKLFAHPYASEKLPSRVARIERLVFGSEQSGPLNERMNKVVALVDTKRETRKPDVVAPASKPTVASAATSVKSFKPSNYPRVTELEKELLEQTFESEPVASRLSRLEGKVFGRAWNDVDLAKRTDRLTEYTYVSPHVAELQRAEMVRVSSRNNSKIAAVPGLSDILPRGLSMLSPVHNLSAVRSVERTTQQPRAATVVDEIESLEKMAYGKISASKPLGQRVDALEVAFGGGNEKQLNITDRVASLMSKVMPNRLGV